MDVPGKPLTPEELLAEMVWLRRLALRIASEVGLAEDALQDTLLAAIRRGPRARTNLRGWLGTVLRNAVRRRARHDRRLEARESVWARGQDWRRGQPLDVSERFALEHDLSQAVRDLEEDLRRVVLLRFLEGRSLREISERVGAPISTVDARLARALGLLRARLERSHGEGDEGARRFRAALLLYLGQEPLPGRSSPSIPWLPVALAAGSVGLVVLLHRSARQEPAPPSPASPAVASAPRDRAPEPGREPAATSATAPRGPARSPVDAPEPGASAPATGSAEIRLVDAARKPLAGIVVCLWPEESAHEGPPRLRTDADGRVRFTGLHAGSWAVAVDRLARSWIEVAPGTSTETTLAARERTITGVVVDETGAPLPDAVVWVLASPGGAFADGAWTRALVEDNAGTRTDAAGRFRLTACGEVWFLGARAPGRAPALPLRLASRDPLVEDLRLVLPDAGGALEGRVLGPDGPLAGALVLVEAFDSDAASLPWLATRSDATGAFRLEGLATGARALTVRSPGLAPWRGSVQVGVAPAAAVEARLTRGARLHGVVRDRAGAPVADAEVRWSSASRRPEPDVAPATVARTRADGSYELAGLAAEEACLLARSTSGRALLELAWTYEEERELDLVLDPPRTVRGGLADEDARPLAGIDLVLACASSGEVARAPTDELGRFELRVFGSGALLLRGFEAGWPVLEERIGDHDAELARVLPQDARPRAFLRGRVADAPGALLVRSADHPDHRGIEYRPDREGRFVAGPLPSGELHLAWRGRACLQGVDPDGIRLGPGEELDLGECRVAAPGSVVLRLEAAGTAPVQAVVLDADGSDVVRPEVDGSSSGFSLARGAYTLQLWSTTRVPRTLAFTVRDGATTELVARLDPGTACEILVDDPGGPRLRSLELRLETADGLSVLATTLSPRLDRPQGGYRLELGLLPGDYVIRGATGDGHGLQAAFAVGAKNPCRVHLRLD